MVGRGLGESRGGVTGDVLKADFGEAAGRAHGGAIATGEYRQNWEHDAIAPQKYPCNSEANDTNGTDFSYLVD